MEVCVRCVPMVPSLYLQPVFPCDKYRAASSTYLLSSVGLPVFVVGYVLGELGAQCQFLPLLLTIKPLWLEVTGETRAMMTVREPGKDF
ncbi:hypothetical protein EYF80_021124 [Liparis tanakae]|uniref:Uncharacterized protein n=1 Tax=Liparis tanakae TaxID=230148 RepID=A0A4Z2HSI4_9TELE|nr:hypothetical protein EYF80_021124 [Liparis tanakae]